MWQCVLCLLRHLWRHDMSFRNRCISAYSPYIGVGGGNSTLWAKPGLANWINFRIEDFFLIEKDHLVCTNTSECIVEKDDKLTLTFNSYFRYCMQVMTLLEIMKMEYQINERKISFFICVIFPICVCKYTANIQFWQSYEYQLTFSF